MRGLIVVRASSKGRIDMHGRWMSGTPVRFQIFGKMFASVVELVFIQNNIDQILQTKNINETHSIIFEQCEENCTSLKVCLNRTRPRLGGVRE